MFLKRKMNGSTNSYSDKILQIKEKISHTVSIPLRQVIICNWIEKPGSF